MLLSTTPMANSSVDGQIVRMLVVGLTQRRIWKGISRGNIVVMVSSEREWREMGDPRVALL